MNFNLNKITLLILELTQREQDANRFVDELFMIKRTNGRCSLYDCIANPCTLQIKSESFKSYEIGHSIYSINYKANYEKLVGKDQQHGHTSLFFSGNQLVGINLGDQNDKFWDDKTANIEYCSVLNDFLIAPNKNLIVQPEDFLKIRKNRSKSSSQSIIVSKNKIDNKKRGKVVLNPISSHKNMIKKLNVLLKEEEKKDDLIQKLNNIDASSGKLKPIRSKSRSYKIFDDKIK